MTHELMIDPGTPLGNGRLDEKVAIVTGAGARAGEGVGTGRATARVFAKHGARVLVVDRDGDAAKITVEEIRKNGGTAEALCADLSLAQDCALLAETAREKWGRIDVLNNNIGIAVGGSIQESTDDDWERSINANLMSVLRVSRAVTPLMAEPTGGAIVNISSVSALRPRGLTPYTTTKGAIISLTRGMAVDLADSGIRVNCVIPGPILTPMISASGLTDEVRARRKNATLVPIEGTGWDVAYAVLFLASSEARFITGTTVTVDGGASIKSPQS